MMAAIDTDPQKTGSTCITCGKEWPRQVRFCGVDGTSLDGSTAAARAEGKFCPECKKHYPAYALFCPDDATTLSQSAREQKPDRQEASSQDVTTRKFPDFPLVPERQAATGQDVTTESVRTDAAQSSPKILTIRHLQGQVLEGKYRLENMLGEGGMAVVYRAIHISMERPVVIKIMHDRLLSDQKSLKRFEQECKVTAKINHPNVVSVFDVGFLNGNQPYLVMEYIEGQTLRDKMEQTTIAPSTTLSILIQICRGLGEAHQVGIIHRDLKPENIILQNRSERPDWVKILDFGIAHFLTDKQKLTKTGNIVGTAEYMAPEQLRNMPLDSRVDIYALGVIMFEMLTNRMPFEADTLEAVLMKQLLEKPPSVTAFKTDLPNAPGFDNILSKALEKEPDRRYQTATEMRLELEGLLESLSSRRGR